MNKFHAALALAAVAITAAPIPASAQASKYVEQSASTGTIGDAYLDAYIALDWDRLEPMLADSVSFQDRTAELLFPNLVKSGKGEVIKGFREGYTGLTKMIFHKTRSFHAGNMAVYEGNLEWGVKFPQGRVVESLTPFIVILRVENGKVVEHRDYVDYQPFLEQERKTRPTQKGK